MKRLIVALMVGGVLFATAWAAAAGLIVDGGTLQAGGDDVLECDADGVQIYFRSDGGPGISWDEAENDFMVHSVVVGGLDSSCNGLVLRVVLTAENGDAISEGEMNPIVVNGNPVVDVDDVAASAVHDVHVLIQD